MHYINTLYHVTIYSLKPSVKLGSTRAISERIQIEIGVELISCIKEHNLEGVCFCVERMDGEERLPARKEDFQIDWRPIEIYFSNFEIGLVTFYVNSLFSFLPPNFRWRPVINFCPGIIRTIRDNIN